MRVCEITNSRDDSKKGVHHEIAVKTNKTQQNKYQYNSYRDVQYNTVKGSSHNYINDL